MIQLTDYEQHVLCLIAVSDKGPRLNGARLMTETSLETAHGINEVMGDHYVNHQTVTAIVTKLIDLGLVEEVGRGADGRVLGIKMAEYEQYWKDVRAQMAFDKRQLKIKFPKH